MNRHNSATWNPKQERLAFLLACGHTIKGAAEECGCGERTAHTWMSEPAFRAHVAELRDVMLGEATGRLAAIATRAVETLDGLMGSESEVVKLRAAVGALKLLFQAREHGELAERMAEMEAAAEQNGRHRP